MPRSPALTSGLAQAFVLGNDVGKPHLDDRRRIEKSVSPGGRVHIGSIWSGNTTKASMGNG